MYKFELELGDWSDDGHGKTEDYLIHSNKPVEDVRESYFKAVGLTGINFGGEVCSDYGDGELDLDLYEKFKELGYVFDEEKWDIEFNSKNICDSIYVERSAFMDLALWFIKLGDSTLELKIIEKDPVDSFHFYGFDEKGRHIEFFGYGLFN